jgi:RNA polymerase sigma factor (sigma-70 family)
VSRHQADGGREAEDLLRELAPQVLGAVVRRFGRFDLAEDAVQEALLAASRQWPVEGMPHQPKAWLVAVAARRLTDQLRSESARRRREDLVAIDPTASAEPSGAMDEAGVGTAVNAVDDTLMLLFLCCHPTLSPASQLALTLRAVGGLSTAEIAKACLVPEATMGQRISRAKQRIRESGMAFDMPPAHERADRLAVVLHVLYLIFNEGHTSTAGPDLQRPELTHEAIRLTRVVQGAMPGDGEVDGLLALMLLTDARRAARTGADGGLVPLAEQDRSTWDTPMMAEGVALLTAALTTARLGPYQLQAAIAAVHAEAACDEATDWHQIVVLYEMLERMAPNPMVTLNRAVAVAMTSGARAGLDVLATLDADARLAGHHRLEAVRAHLLERLGDVEGAYTAYRRAARRTTSLPERRHLDARASALVPPGLPHRDTD